MTTRGEFRSDGNDIYLEPGDLFFGSGSGRVRTILGSCVAITLWHPHRKLAGVCHFVLPTRQGPVQGQRDGRYGDEAIAIFSSNIRRHNTQAGEYQVGVFGGGDMFPSVDMSAVEKVGEKNISVAKALVAKNGFVLLYEDTGGCFQRHITMDQATGKVLLRKKMVSQDTACKR